MLLSKGQWLGEGSVLVSGASLGDDIQISLEITEDQGGLTLTGTMGGDYKGDLSIRIAPDEVGTYVIDARVAGAALDGIGKLESVPNLTLVWNEAHTQSGTVALFGVNNGIGCRGFLHEGAHTLTWEILFKLKQQVVGGDNVVSLARRRR